MPISHESQYCLDSEFEMLGITPDVHTFCYHVNLDIDGLIDNRVTNLSTYYKESYQTWWENAPGVERLHVMEKSFPGLDFQYEELINTICNNVILPYVDEECGVNSDMLLGLVGRNRLIVTSIDQMYDPAIVRASLEMSSSHMNWLHDIIPMGERFQSIQHHRSELQGYRNSGCIPTTTNLNVEQYHINVHSEGSNIRLIGNTKIEESQLDDAKRALKKGIKLFSSMFGEQKIKDFLSGGMIEAEGERFIYTISSPKNVLEYTVKINPGSIPFTFNIYTKDGVYLGDGCVVFNDSPIVDQLLALMLNLTHGNEDDIIRNTNIYARTEAFKTDPHMTELGKNDSLKYDIDISRFGPVSDRNEMYEEITYDLRPHFERVVNEMFNINNILHVTRNLQIP